MAKTKATPQKRTLRTYTAYVEFDQGTTLYVGIIPGIPGAHSQGKTLDELQRNLKEVLELCLDEEGSIKAPPPKFIGLQQIEVAE